MTDHAREAAEKIVPQHVTGDGDALERLRVVEQQTAWAASVIQAHIDAACAEREPKFGGVIPTGIGFYFVQYEDDDVEPVEVILDRSELRVLMPGVGASLPLNATCFIKWSGPIVKPK